MFLLSLNYGDSKPHPCQKHAQGNDTSGCGKDTKYLRARKKHSAGNGCIHDQPFLHPAAQCLHFIAVKMNVDIVDRRGKAERQQRNGQKQHGNRWCYFFARPKGGQFTAQRGKHTTRERMQVQPVRLAAQKHDAPVQQ